MRLPRYIGINGNFTRLHEDSSDKMEKNSNAVSIVGAALASKYLTLPADGHSMVLGTRYLEQVMRRVGGGLVVL